MHTLSEAFHGGRLLGEGGAGQARVCNFNGPGLPFVVKRIPPPATAAGRTGIGELRMLEQLRHPNIIGLLGHHEAPDGSLFLAIEFADGGSMRSVLQGYGALPHTFVRHCMRQALSALAYIHEKGIAHCDIKPANMLLFRPATLKLADFGAAITISECLRTGETSWGTPMYMAPEAIRNRVHPGADIWAVGCTALELLTNTPPWASLGCEDAMQLLFHIGNTKSAPPLPLDAELPADAIDFLRMATQLDPAHRPAAAALVEHPFLATTADVTEFAALLEFSEERSPSEISILTGSDEHEFPNRSLPPQGPPHLWQRCTPLCETPKIVTPALSHHSAVVLHDRMLVFGGIGSRGALNARVYQLDLAAHPHCWSTPFDSARGPVPTPRCGQSTIVNEDLPDERGPVVVMFGGQRASRAAIGELLLFYPGARGDTGQWTVQETTGVCPRPRWGHSAAYCERTQCMFVFGGCSDMGPCFDLFAFHLPTSTWREVERSAMSGPAPSGLRTWHTAEISQGQLFVAARTVSGQPALFSLTTEAPHRWRLVTQLPAKGTSPHRRLLAVEGGDGDVLCVSVPEILRISAATGMGAPLRQCATASVARVLRHIEGHTAVVHEGVVIIFGGKTSQGTSSRVFSIALTDTLIANTDRKQSGASELPEELWFIICSFSQPRELCRLARLNRTLLSVAQIPELWRVVSQQRWPSLALVGDPALSWKQQYEHLSQAERSWATKGWPETQVSTRRPQVSDFRTVVLSSGLIATTVDDALRFYNPRNRQALQPCFAVKPAVPCQPVCMALHTPTATLAAGCKDRSVTLFSCNTAEALTRFQGHTAQPCCVRITERHVVSGALDNTVRLWSRASGRQFATFAGHTTPPTAVQLDDNTGELMCSISDTEVLVHNIQQLRETPATPVANLFPVGQRQLYASHLFSNLVVAGAYGFAVIWDLRSAGEVMRVPAHRGAVRSVRLLEASSLLTGGGDSDPTVCRFDLRSPRAPDIGPLTGAHDRGIVRILAHPCSPGKIVTQSDDALCLWDLPRVHHRVSVIGGSPMFPVRSAAWDEYRLVFVTGCVLRIWDLSGWGDRQRMTKATIN